MSHRSHEHVTPLRRRPRSGHLVGNRFGAVVGAFDHATLSPHDGKRPDDNHVYLWVAIRSGEYAGRYEAAINIHSTDGSRIQFAELEEAVADEDLPTDGFFPAKLAYRDLGLTQDQFRSQSNEELHVELVNQAQDCDFLAVYGHTYPGGDGLHDVHQNSGEPAGSHHPNLQSQDGALVFYFRQPDGQAIARWAFIKFSTQSL